MIVAYFGQRTKPVLASLLTFDAKLLHGGRGLLVGRCDQLVDVLVGEDLESDFFRNGLLSIDVFGLLIRWVFVAHEGALPDLEGKRQLASGDGILDSIPEGGVRSVDLYVLGLCIAGQKLTLLVIELAWDDDLQHGDQITSATRAQSRKPLAVDSEDGSVLCSLRYFDMTFQFILIKQWNRNGRAHGQLRERHGQGDDQVVTIPFELIMRFHTTDHMEITPPRRS